jgi:hypothetical protein
MQYGGQEEDKGALFAQAGAVSVTGSTFKGNRVAIVVADGSRFKTIDGNQFSGSEKKTIDIDVDSLHLLGAANTYAANERIAVRGGDFRGNRTWVPQGAPIEVDGGISMNLGAVLTLSPGLELRFKPEGRIEVGYFDGASLHAAGTADKPIRLRGTRDEQGSWKGLLFYRGSKDSVLDNVLIANASEEAAVVFQHDTTAKISNLTCDKCIGAALKWDCESKLDIGSIKVHGGAAIAELKPQNCSK